MSWPYHMRQWIPVALLLVEAVTGIWYVTTFTYPRSLGLTVIFMLILGLMGILIASAVWLFFLDVMGRFGVAGAEEPQWQTALWAALWHGALTVGLWGSTLYLLFPLGYVNLGLGGATMVLFNLFTSASAAGVFVLGWLLRQRADHSWLSTGVRRGLAIALVISVTVFMFLAGRSAWGLGQSYPFGPLGPPETPVIAAEGIPTETVTPFLFTLHNRLNGMMFRQGSPVPPDAEWKSAGFVPLRSRYDNEIRPALVSTSNQDAPTLHRQRLRKDLDRIMTLLEEEENRLSNDAGDTSVITYDEARAAHRIVHDLDTHYIGTQRSPEYFGASHLVEHLKNEKGPLVTVSREPHYADAVQLMQWVEAAVAALGVLLVVWPYPGKKFFIFR